MCCGKKKHSCYKTHTEYCPIKGRNTLAGSQSNFKVTAQMLFPVLKSILSGYENIIG